MHLLYLDESGSISDPSQRYFVLAGVAVFERSTHWVEQELNAVVQRFNATNPHAIELHGSPMRSGNEGWRNFPRADRQQAMLDALAIARDHHRQDHLRLFGVAVRKQAAPGTDAAELAFEQLVSRFDLYLKRLYAVRKDAQRGLILLDKSATEQRLQTLAREFKYHGHTWGQTRNYAEVPVFLDSRASRLIQLADLVSYAIFRHFEANDSTYFSVIQNSFDSEGGVQHGFYLRT